MLSFYRFILSFALALATAAGVSGSSMPAPSILQIATSDENFSTLVAAVEAAGLVEALSGKGPFSEWHRFENGWSVDVAFWS